MQAQASRQGVRTMSSGAALPCTVSWKVTRRCTLSCPHCDLDEKDRTACRSTELSPADARFVIDELCYLGRPLVLVLHGGEPMLREDICDIVAYSREAGFRTTIETHGTALTRKKILSLKNAGLTTLAVSFDSPDPIVNDRARGLEGSWQEAQDALREARELGIETTITISLHKGNSPTIAEMVRLADMRNASAVTFSFFSCRGEGVRGGLDARSYHEALLKIAECAIVPKGARVCTVCAPQFVRLSQEQEGAVSQPATGCAAGRDLLAIDPDGSVTPCRPLNLALGNVKEISLADLWEKSPSLMRLRRGRYAGRCGSCSASVLCGGCRARALAVLGDFMGEDPLCDYVAGASGRVLKTDDRQCRAGEDGTSQADGTEGALSAGCCCGELSSCADVPASGLGIERKEAR